MMRHSSVEQASFQASLARNMPGAVLVSAEKRSGLELPRERMWTCWSGRARGSLKNTTHEKGTERAGWKPALRVRRRSR